MATSDCTVQIPLTKGYTAIVDAIDADLLEFNWQAADANDGLVYAVGANNRRLHRIIMERVLGYKPSSRIHVDHENGNGLDNRRCNLRLATVGQNIANSRLSKNSTSGYKGVSWNESKQVFIARIGFDNQRISLGNFRSAQDAAIAYNRAAKKYFGEYARFNDIPGWETAEIQEVLVPSDNKTGYRGVSYRASTGKYRATYRGKEIGTYSTGELAYEAYLKARENAR